MSFPYVCPEPVLVKCSFSYVNGSKRPFLLTPPPLMMLSGTPKRVPCLAGGRGWFPCETQTENFVRSNDVSRATILPRETRDKRSLILIVLAIPDHRPKRTGRLPGAENGGNVDSVRRLKNDCLRGNTTLFLSAFPMFVPSLSW